jgi:hypothetical protein
LGFFEFGFDLLAGFAACGVLRKGVGEQSGQQAHEDGGNDLGMAHVGFL